MQIDKKDSNTENISWRETPWDQKIFDCRTIEILEFNAVNLHAGLTSLKKLQSDLNPDLIYGRFDSSNQLLKKIFLLDGFFQCETALKIRKNKLHQYEPPKLIKGRELNISEGLNNIDKDFLVKETLGMYSYSRFHEDPFVSIQNANRRMSNWVKQLIENDTQVIFHRDKKHKITSYLFYKSTGSEAEMILGGSLNGKGMYAPFFFGGVLKYFQNKEFKTISTSVSAANRGILSLYITLGFNVLNIKSDYHKHLKKK